MLLKLPCAQESQGELVRVQILTWQVWGGDPEIPFLTSSHLVLMNRTWSSDEAPELTRARS